MSRLDEQHLVTAREILSRYAVRRSATIPLLHLSQEQNGYITQDAMAHVAELTGTTPAEVYGTATFYEMFKFQPVGKFCVNICNSISCHLMGSGELLEHAEHRLGIRPGSTTPDGVFTLEAVECIAACTEAPAVQANYRYRYRVTPQQFDAFLDDLAGGRLDEEIPPHGTLARTRQHIPADKAAGNIAPDVPVAPPWMEQPA